MSAEGREQGVSAGGAGIGLVTEVTVPRSRRALIGGLVGGAVAYLAAALGRGTPAANAAAGSNLVIGTSNSSGSSQTVLTSSAGGASFTLRDTAAGGTGIFGWSSAASGAGRGLYGRADSPDGIGVQARQLGATAGTGAAIDVLSEKNTALKVVMNNPSKNAVTIDHKGSGANGFGLLIDSDWVPIKVTGAAGGVFATSAQTAIYGETTTNVTAVYGTSSAGAGVVGNSTSNVGVSGASTSGSGVQGQSSTSYGVRGTSGNNYGVSGSSTFGTGTHGSGPVAGVRGDSTGGFAVYGVGGIGTGGYFATNSLRGVVGTAAPSGDGVVGYATAGWSGRFTSDARVDGIFQVGGDCQIEGSISKAGGSFRIDHPLDPSGKYLSHSFVESPDMLNVYNGVATLNAKGEATVGMAAWFQALNRDYRYQLTALGGPAPDLHVKTELTDGHFTIGGGAAAQRVSWQVTGIRQDAWANANRIQVEERKTGKESGTYLHPEVHGRPKSERVPAKHPMLDLDTAPAA